VADELTSPTSRRRPPKIKSGPKRTVGGEGSIPRGRPRAPSGMSGVQPGSKVQRATRAAQSANSLNKGWRVAAATLPTWRGTIPARVRTFNRAASEARLETSFGGLGGVLPSALGALYRLRKELLKSPRVLSSSELQERDPCVRRSVRRQGVRAGARGLLAGHDRR
jgi:hypothetical protein